MRKRFGSGVCALGPGFRVARVLLALMFVFGLVGRALAQVETATLSGTITDPTGAVVAGAEVRAVRIDTGTSYVSTTNASGLYLIVGLQPGHFRIFVTKQGFKEIELTDVTLNVQDTVSRNFSLEVGAASETVTVRADDLHINTTDASVSTVVDRQFLESIPLNGRSLQPLITLTPGVVLTPTNVNNQGQFSVNGQRGDGNYFTVDGVSANIGVSGGGGPSQAAAGSVGGFNVLGGTNSLVSIDAIQEFRIQTSSMAPEFGRTPGGQISIVTRSGTNQFHGDVFDYFRNDVLDANDWFADSKGLPKAALRQNDFGGVFGGPIFKEKTFFFFSYEGLRLVQPQTGIARLPTVGFRQGAPTNIQPLLNALPIPNGTDFGNGAQEFDASFSNPSTLNATSIRVDHKITNKITLFGRYNYATSESVQRQTPYSTLFALNFPLHTVTVGSSQLLSPRISNELRFNYSSSNQTGSHSLDTFGGAVPVPFSLFSVPSGVASSDTSIDFGIRGAGGFSLGKFQGNSQKQWNLVDSLSVTRGTHQLKFGVDYRRLLPEFSPVGYQQVLTFFGLTGSGGVSSTIPFVIIGAKDGVGMVFNNFSSYAQDTWRATARLTLTYGLRWELNPPFLGKSGTPLYTVLGLENLANVTAFTPSNLTLAPGGTPFFKTTYYNFAPRLGAAYRLRTSPGYELVVRGGGGLFYDLGAGVLANGAAFFPYARSNRFRNVPFPVPTSQAAPPPFSTAIPPGGVSLTTATEPHLQLPRTYQWNAAIEQSLGSRQTISATYVGALGRKLLNRNQLSFGSGDIQTLFLTTNAASSDYHALQLKYQLRLTRGLQALGYYSWSHSIDTLSTDSGDFLSNPNIDRGNSDFDIRNAFHAALVYDVPTPRLGIVGGAILKNWSVSANVVAQSAAPVDLSSSLFLSSPDLLSFVSARPDVVSGQPFYLYGKQYPGGKAFNPNAFMDPPINPTFGIAARQGTLGRNVLRGFGLAQLDFSLRRKFNLTERVNLQFSTEFFNILNHPNFGGIDACTCDTGLFGLASLMFGTSLGSGGMGGGFNPLYQIGGPRSIQFALKLAF